MSGLPGELGVGVGQIGLQRGPADRRAAAGGEVRVGLRDVDEREQVRVPVGEGAVDAGGAAIADTLISPLVLVAAVIAVITRCLRRAEST